MRATGLHTEHLAHGGNNVLRVRQGGLLQAVVIGNRNIQRRHPYRCGIQLEETFLVDDRHDFRPHTDGRLCLLDDHGAVRPADRVANAGAIQRAEREQVG